MATSLRQRPLGTSGLHLTTIGFGTWAMGGGDWKFGWGAQDDAESVRAIEAGLDAGINWLDTAAIYGHGHSEEIVGRAIAGRRDEVIVATKCGRVWEGDSREIGKRLTRASVLAECDASLRRLQVEAIDLYQIHWPEPDEEVEEGWAAIGELIDAGKVRYAGVCNFSLSQLQRAQAIRPIALGRKNALFAGSDGGARHWAIVASLVATAKLNGVEPLAWLADVLERMVSGRTKAHELERLLPWAWMAERPAAAVNA